MENSSTTGAISNASTKKLFCLDFEDSTKNTTTKITDTVNGIEITKATAGSIEFLNNYNGFGRVLRCNTRTAENVYTQSWDTIQANFPLKFPLKGAYTMVWFTNSMGTNTIRSGLCAVYNKLQLAGWQGYLNNIFYGSTVQDIMKNLYDGATASSDIGMYYIMFDKDNNLCGRSMADTGFHYEMGVPPKPYYDPTGGEFVFCRSQEASYYFAAGGICAGFAIYSGILSVYELQYIYNNKKLVDFII